MGAGIAISAICLALVLRQADLAAVAGALWRADLFMLAGALAAVGLTIYAKAARWKVLFYPQGEGLRLGKLFAIILIGQLVNTAVPARMGELARAYLVGELEGVSKAFAFGTIVVEKVVDAAMAAVLVALIVPFVLLPSWFQPWAFVLLAAAALVGAGLVAWGQEGAQRWVVAFSGRLPRFGPALVGMVGRALTSFGVLRQRGAAPGLWGWSAVAWSGAVLTTYAAMRALGLDLSGAAAAFVLVVVQLGAALPSSPGRVGVYEYLVVVALSVFGVDASLALGVGILLHLVVYGPPVLLGAFCLWRESLSLGQVARLAAGEKALRPSQEGLRQGGA